MCYRFLLWVFKIFSGGWENLGQISDGQDMSHRAATLGRGVRRDANRNLKEDYLLKDNSTKKRHPDFYDRYLSFKYPELPMVLTASQCEMPMSQV